MNENGTHQDISLKELAAYCGLSSATVSDVINGKARQKRISAKTETRILDAAKRLGYRPNRLAACFRRGQNPAIGVFLPDQAYAPVAALSMGISNAALKDNIPLNFYYGLQDSDYASFLDLVSINGNCGIISYMPSFAAFEDKISHFTERGGIVVMLNSPSMENLNVKYLSLRNYDAGVIAARGLARSGCEEFHAFCAHDIQGGQREAGFRDYLRKKKIQPHLHEGNDWKEAVLKTIIRRTARKTVGIFAWTDFVALEMFRSFRALGAAGKIGKSIKIIGCDNSPFCHSMDPPLSSVDLAFRELGFTAMKYLLECMSAPDTPPPPLPEPHLEQRESS